MVTAATEILYEVYGCSPPTVWLVREVGVLCEETEEGEVMGNRVMK